MIHFLVQLGRLDEAKIELRAILDSRSGFTISGFTQRVAAYSQDYVARRVASFRAAGVPE